MSPKSKIVLVLRNMDDLDFDLIDDPISQLKFCKVAKATLVPYHT